MFSLSIIWAMEMAFCVLGGAETPRISASEAAPSTRLLCTLGIGDGVLPFAGTTFSASCLAAKNAALVSPFFTGFSFSFLRELMSSWTSSSVKTIGVFRRDLILKIVGLLLRFRAFSIMAL